jgi:hypothetical protein
MLLLVPAERVAVVVLCNLEKVRLQPLARRIAELVAPLPAAAAGEKAPAAGRPAEVR